MVPSLRARRGGLSRIAPTEVEPVQILRAIARLWQAQHRVRHVPSLAQLRAMAWLDGREPCSYLLDPKVNYVPKPARGHGPYGLCFSRYDDEGYIVEELVVLRDGGAFDLLGGF